MKKTKAMKDGGLKSAIKRVIAERDEVQTRLSKLCAFMDDSFEDCKFLELSPANRILLERQRAVMQEYRDILDVRIELMTGELPR